jgi:hypothetical protein
VEHTLVLPFKSRFISSYDPLKVTDHSGNYSFECHSADWHAAIEHNDIQPHGNLKNDIQCND